MEISSLARLPLSLEVTDTADCSRRTDARTHRSLSKRIGRGSGSDIQSIRTAVHLLCLQSAGGRDTLHNTDRLQTASREK